MNHANVALSWPEAEELEQLGVVNPASPTLTAAKSK